MKKVVTIIMLCLIISISLIQRTNTKNDELIFNVIDAILNTENNNTRLYLNIRNSSSKKVDLGRFVIELYDVNMRMIVSSGASICNYGNEGCIIKPFEIRTFTLTVGVDATDTKYVEYRLD